MGEGGKGAGITVAIKEVCKEVEVASPFLGSNLAICQVYGVCFVNSTTVWIIMELHGCDLATYMGSLNEPLSPSLQLKLCKHASDSVLALHQADPPILHRDIKSDNFLIVGNSFLWGILGNPRQLKMVDYQQEHTDGLLLRSSVMVERSGLQLPISSALEWCFITL